MSLTSKQLGLLLLCLCAITLTVAWIIERRQILSFRAELDAYGTSTSPPAGGPLTGTAGAGLAATGGYPIDYPITSSPSVDDDQLGEDGLPE